MPTVQLPAKLKKDPLVDAVFEIRFSSALPASSVIPGILFSTLKANPQQLERLPAFDIPSQMRALNPALQFQPLMRMHWNDNYFILIGDVALGLACKIPYPGWKSFKSHIIDLAKLLNATQFINQIERYSLKYTGIIEGKDVREQITRIKLDLIFATYTSDLTPTTYNLKAEPFNVRIEMQRDSFLYVMHLGAPATANLAHSNQRTGLLVDIDGIREHRTANLSEFISELPNRVEEMHTHNKQLFFGLLTDDTLAYLEPIYKPVFG
jgi:uncharacterized protein (TIGR04255 family)